MAMQNGLQCGAPPIVVGGVGGSGTRVIAALLRGAGVFIGDELNDALDNMRLTALFPSTRQRLRALAANQRPPGKACADYILKFDDDIEQFFRDRMRAFEREMLSAFERQTECRAAWGWKGPPSFNFLELFQRHLGPFRYIHVVRHGVDMAFSSNQNQVVNWGWRYGLAPDPSPANALRYWVCANRQAVFDARRLGIDVLVINFDHMCADPMRGVGELLSFINIECSERTRLADLVQTPGSIGRRGDFDLAFVDDDAREALAEFGFA